VYQATAFVAFPGFAFRLDQVIEWHAQEAAEAAAAVASMLSSA